MSASINDLVAEARQKIDTLAEAGALAQLRQEVDSWATTIANFVADGRYPADTTVALYVHARGRYAALVDGMTS